MGAHTPSPGWAGEAGDTTVFGGGVAVEQLAGIVVDVDECFPNASAGGFPPFFGGLSAYHSFSNQVTTPPR